MKIAFKPQILFFVALMASAVVKAEWIPITLIIDNVKIGDLTTDINKKSQAVAVRGEELAGILRSYIQQDKLVRFKKLTEADGSLSLVNLERAGISSKYSDKNLTITLIIPIDIRVVKDFPVLLRKEKTGLPLYSKNYSGYLNMRGSVGYTDQNAPTSYSNTKNPAQGQLELVQNFNVFTLESTGNYREYEEKPLQRNDTSIVHDFEDSRIRLRIGDFVTGVQGFQANMPAAGIQVQKQFNIHPERGSISKRSTNIQVKNNSLLEVYVNDVLISRYRVNAGQYNLKDLPLLYGQNRVRIVLIDDFGGREEFLVDMLFDDQILAEGVQDFTYQVGRPSYLSGIEKKYSDDNFSSFYHKYGYSDTTTLFFNHQNFQSSNLFGLGTGLLTKYGTNYIDLGYYTDSTSKSDGALRWRYNSPELNQWGVNRFRFFGGVELRTKGYNTITLNGPISTNFSERYDFIFQKQLTDRSSMALGVTTTIGQNVGNNDLNRRFTYQNQFARNWRFDVSYSWSEQQKDIDQVLLTLNWLEPEGKAQAAFSYDTVDRNSLVRVTKNNRVNYNDLQMDVTASKQKSNSSKIDSQYMDFSANYYATKYEARMQLGADSSSANLNTRGQFGFGTALAWTQDSMSFARPITDSFAIVEAQGLGKNQTLNLPNGTDRDSVKISDYENFVFSDLTSYIERPLKLDSTNLGVSSHLDRESYILNPRYRTGFYVPLKVIKSLLVHGRLVGDTKDQVSYITGQVLDESGNVFTNNFFTDESGNFVLDGLTYGKYQIVLSDRRLKKINFVLEAPDEDKTEDEDVSDIDLQEYELGTIKLEKETAR